MVAENALSLILEWKEMENIVWGVFKLPGDVSEPLSCLILEWRFHSSWFTTRVYVKWVLHRIEDLNDLLKSVQSARPVWERSRQRLNVPLPAEDWEWGYPEQ